MCVSIVAGGGRKIDLKLARYQVIDVEVKKTVLKDIKSDTTSVGKFLRGYGFLVEDIVTADADCGISFTLVPYDHNKVNSSYCGFAIFRVR